MKNLFLSVIFLLITSPLLMAQYFFGAQVSSFDSCCIYIKAGVKSDDGSLDTTWHVVVDGVTTYDVNSPDYVSSSNSILHCFEGNGTHNVSFFVNGELYWSRTVEIENCQGECSVCDIPSTVIDQGIIDTCAHEAFLCVRFPNINGQIGFSDSCTNPVYTWNFGDGSPLVNQGSQMHVFHNYAQPGTYTVCVNIAVTSPDGGTCVTSECTQVVVPECDTIVEPCCGFELGDVTYRTHPAVPCGAMLSVSRRAYNGDCSNHTLSWDIDGDGITDGTGSSFIANFNGPGPHHVCLTMAYGNCSVTSCGTVYLPACSGSDDKPDGKESLQKSQSWEEVLAAASALELFPNPATTELNLVLSTDIAHIQLIDITGKVVQELSTNTIPQLAIDIQALAPGVYFVQGLDKQGTLKVTERFVKVR